jgi:DNA polymerase-3 subunit epsilon
LVTRRLEPRGSYAVPDGSPSTRGIILDVETTGLDVQRDGIIQLALLPFEYSAEDGRIFRVGQASVHLQDPGRPIPPVVSRLTGIRDADVAGKKLDERAVAEIASGAGIVIAHNAGFDRPVVERRLPWFRKLSWGCSQVEVPWAEHGIASAKLDYVLFRHCRAFFDGHRADQDCYAALHALATPFRTGELPLQLLIQSSRRRTARIWALDAPYDSRHVLKARRWRWNSGEDGRPKAWHSDVAEDAVDAECEWLREAVYCGRRGTPWRMRVFDALDRYSTRI